MARYAYNPFTGNLDRIGDGGSGAITEVTATNAGSTVSFETTGTTENLELTDSLFNTILGEDAGNTSLTGGFNTGLGAGALFDLTSGIYNTAVGLNSLTNLTSGTYNTAIGANAGSILTDEIGNILIGPDVVGVAGESQTIRIGNTQSATYIAGIAGVAVSNTQIVTIDTTNGQMGSQSANFGDVTGPASSADNNLVVFDGLTGKIIKDTGISSIAPTFSGNVTSLSTFSMPFDTGAGEGFYLSSGQNMMRSVGNAAANFFFGNSGNSGLTGIANTGAGQAALASLINGNQNTALGSGAMLASNGSSSNCSVGYFSMANMALGQNNTAMGWAALGGVSTNLNNNCAFGLQALVGISTGTGNNAFGFQAGSAHTLGDSNNIDIAFAGVAGESGAINIGNSVIHNKCRIQGINGVTVTGTAVLCATDGQLGTVVSSERYKENIQDIPSNISIMDLRPVKFNYKTFKETSYGLIAEEVDKNFPYLCFYKEGKPESVKYHELCIFLLAELQRMEKRIKNLEIS